MIAAIIAGLASLLIIGPNILFPYGLAIGTCIAIVNLNIISVSINSAVAKGRRGPVIAAFIIRIVIYGAVFLMGARTSYISGLGVAIGFVLPNISMLVMYLLWPAIKRKMGKEEHATYVTDTRSNLFIKDPWLEHTYRGRNYLTYKHYRKIRIVSAPAGAEMKEARDS